MQPGPFFLGQLRPGGDAFLRPARAAASGRDSALARYGDARSLRAGGEQRRLLAGERGQPTPLYYSYAYPEPPGFAGTRRSQPAEASYYAPLHEFILPYDAVRTAAVPDDALLAFAQSTYDAASTRGKWDRAALEEVTLKPPVEV